MISVAEIKKLLLSFGYTAQQKDEALIELAIERVWISVKAFTHLKHIPDELKPEMMSMIVGEFLYAKKNLGGLEEGGIVFPKRVSQITEGDTSLSISNIGKTEDDFDDMIDALRHGNPHVLEHWRALHW